jgi:NADH:ubiquinone oxidoreductase subunit E
MLYGAEVAVCSEIATKHMNTVWTQYQFFSFKPVGARNQ